MSDGRGQLYSSAYDASMSHGVERPQFSEKQLRAEREMLRAFMPGFPTFSVRPRCVGGPVDLVRLAAISRGLPIAVRANLAGCSQWAVRKHS